jgi:hypothetical protein
VDVAALSANLPTVGGAGILLVIIAILLRMFHISTGELMRVRAAYTAEITRINKTHDDELAELRATITELRRRQNELEQSVDEERRLRRLAEDERYRTLRQPGVADA